jgi:hypothetical protein
MKQQCYDKKIDPFDFGILLMIAAVVGGAGGAITIVDSIRKRRGEVPSRVYGKLADAMDRLSDELGHLAGDIAILKEIFVNAEGADRRNRPIEFGTSTFLSVGDFMRYERISAAALNRIRTINKLTNQIERYASLLAPQGIRVPVKASNTGMTKLKRLVRASELTTPEAWMLVQSATDDLKAMVDDLRRQFRSPEGK